MVWVNELREKIEQLAKGKFEYETPEIIVSREVIEFDVEIGKVYKGSFMIQNSQETNIKGVIYSSNRLFHISNTSFSGVENEITYEFHADKVETLETVKGHIDIVSSSGEIEVTFIAHVEQPYCITSLGKIRDLFQFANLAKSDPVEAIKLFKSEKFPRVFVRNDTSIMTIYNGLIKSVSPSQALEEFLIAVHKKLQINVSVNQNSFSYESVHEIFKDKVVLVKDNWGHAEFKVSTDASFITLEHKYIWTDNFLGNQYQLEFLVDPSLMKHGRNNGKIVLKSVHQTIIVEITATSAGKEWKKSATHLKKREHEIQLIRKYLEFRVNHIDKATYEMSAKAILTRLSEIEHSTSLDLFKTHLYIISGNDKLANEMMQQFLEKEEELKKFELDYLGYLYIKALYSKQDADIDEAVSTISRHYEQGYTDVQVLWYLFYLDKKYDNSKTAKLEEINKKYYLGTHSPVLYFEACSVYNEEPSLLRELGNFEIQVIHWGIRYDFISQEVMNQFIFLANKEKGFNQMIYQDLVLLYEKYNTTDILSAICRLLIKGQKTQSKYFVWYQLGVEAQLKITQLHEYYMYAIDEEKDIQLAHSILLYFVYNSTLSDKKKAFLYASIMKGKDSNASMYRTYFKQMEIFAIKQIKKHNISRHLKIIYEDIVTNEMINEELAKPLAVILFSNEVVCECSNMVGVYVVHPELEDETYVPFIEGKALVHIFTENAELFFVDEQNNRYVSTVKYSINKFINSSKYVERCYEMKARNIELLLNLSEKIGNYQKSDAYTVEIQNLVCENTKFKIENKVKFCQGLIQYYYDNMDGEMLEFLLNKVDLSYVDVKERAKLIEFMILRNLEEKALHSIKEFGYEGISVKRLIKLCSRMISLERQQEEEKVFLDLCYQVFHLGKYDDAILNYLMEHYVGTTKKMFELWKSALEFEIDTEELEERLIGQMLFSDSGIANSLDLFLSYYRRGKNRTIIRAYTSYFAYKHLVSDRVLPKELFEIMKREAVYVENEVCMLALLKYYSDQDNLTKEELKMVDYNLHRFVEKGLVLPFFRKYKNRIRIPHSIYDKYYVEYITNPNKKVQIHYIIGNEENQKEFISELMPNTYNGIHIKDFILFFNEKLQYYISEENESGQIITESISVELDNPIDEKVENRYGQINLMLMSKEMQDEKTLIDMMKNYVKTEGVTLSLFKPL